MKYTSTKDSRFLWNTQKKFQDDARVLILVRYVYAAGNRDYILQENFEQFAELVVRLNEKDSVMIARRFTVIKEGGVDQRFIDELISMYPSGSSWILIGADNFEYTSDWAYAETVSELNEGLGDRIGNNVCVVDEPDYINTEKFMEAYVPDSDGIVRPGVY